VAAPGAARRSIPYNPQRDARSAASVAGSRAGGFGADTFAFRNDSRIHHRGQPDIYCNRCFLMARAVGQFHRFARFVPEEPRLPSAAYALLVRRITRRAAWRAPLPDAERIVIPGFASLHAFSRREERG
jgi:hypothetical protein